MKERPRSPSENSPGAFEQIDSERPGELGIEHKPERGGAVLAGLSGTERIVVIVAALVFLTVGFVFGRVAISAYLDLQKLPSAPSPVSMSEAATLVADGSDKPWVQITDAVFQCDSLEVETGDKGTGRTRIIATDRNQRVVIVADYHGRLSCPEVMQRKAVGVLSRMTQERYDRFNMKSAIQTSMPGVDVAVAPLYDLSAYKKAEVFMELDNAGGRSGRGGQMVIGAFGVLIALGAGAELLRRLWRVRQGHALFER